jgi:tetratricopeptide (TPR) repeat protein
VSFGKANHIVERKIISANLKKMDSTDIKKFLGDSSSINYDSIAKNVENKYQEEIHLWQSRIDRDNSAINSGTKWLLILKNMKKYDVIITNQLIINDSYDPFSPVSILHGAIVKGFAGQNRALVSTAILDRKNSDRDDGQFIPYLLIHELGHALFNLSHTDEYSASVMSPDKYLKVPVFTENERNIIRANLIMRDGEKFLNQRDYTRAIEKFNDALNRDPNCYYCAYLLARVHYELRDYGSSVSYLKLTTRLKPTWSLPYERLGDIYGSVYKFGAKDVNNAIVNYMKAVGLEPSNVALHLKLAKSFEKTGRAKKAEQVYLEVIKIEPSNSTALQALENLRKYK